jgi:hypothetical protein
MKKVQLTLLVFFALYTGAQAQVNIFNATGPAGIGIYNGHTPLAPLDFGEANGVKMLVYGVGGNSGYYWGLGVNLGQAPNEASVFIGGGNGTCCGAENFAVVSANQASWPYTSYTTRFIVNSSTGNVGIGTLHVSDVNYKLFVETGIRTRKVVVDQATWPDYVFHPGYRTPSLDSVAQYIRTNRHLPDMPSAESVARNGLNLGENQAQLLKKIEELTLYVIELRKEVDELKQQNKKPALSPTY